MVAWKLAFNHVKRDRLRLTAAAIFHERCVLARVVTAWRRAHRRALHLQHIQRSRLPQYMHQRSLQRSVFRDWRQAATGLAETRLAADRLRNGLARWRQQHLRRREGQMQMQHARHRLDAAKARHALHSWQLRCRVAAAHRMLLGHLDEGSRQAALARAVRQWAHNAHRGHHNRQQHIMAVDAAAKSCQRAAFVTWAAQVRDKRQLQVAVMHHCARLQARAWAAWRWSTRRTQLMHTTTMRVVRHVRLEVQASAFATWRRVAQRAMQRRQAVRCCMLRGRADTATAALQRWAVYASQERRVRNKAACLLEQRQRQGAAAAVHLWLHWARQCTRQRRLLLTKRAFMQAKDANTAAVMLRHWTAVGQGLHARLQSAGGQVHAAVRTRAARGALQRWRQAGQVQTAVRHHRLVSAFSAWRGYSRDAARLRATGGAAAKASTRRRLRRALRCWRRHAAQLYANKVAYCKLLPCICSLSLGQALGAVQGRGPGHVITRSLLKCLLLRGGPMLHNSPAQLALYLPSEWRWSVRRVVASCEQQATARAVLNLHWAQRAQTCAQAPQPQAAQAAQASHASHATASAASPLLSALAQAKQAASCSLVEQRLLTGRLRSKAHTTGTQGLAEEPAALTPSRQTHRPSYRRLAGGAAPAPVPAAERTRQVRAPPRKLPDGF